VLQNSAVIRSIVNIAVFAVVVYAATACGNSSAGGSGTTKTGSGGASGSGSANSSPMIPESGSGQAAAANDPPGKKQWLMYCALCHGAEGKGYAADNAPSMVNPTFLASADDDFLKNGIELGRPGTAMAPYGKAQGGPLAPADTAAIISYIRLMGGNIAAAKLPKPGVGNADSGAKLYEANCKRCHGDEKVRGPNIHLANQALLASASDSFLLHALREGRPGTPMEAFATKFTAQQQDDLIAYIRRWQSKTPVPTVAYAAPTGTEAVVLNPKGGAPTFKLKDDRFVAADDVLAAFKAKKKMILIDARPPSEWSRGHIPGAIAVAYYDTKTLDRVPNDGTWVLAYCACPHHASGMVVDELRKRGFKNTAVIDEGILVWKQRGYPIATAELKPEQLQEEAKQRQSEDHSGHNHP
jgi:cytochrome c oxidase cbb3-type subunit III